VSLRAQETKPAASVAVEGGYGLEAKIGPVKVGGSVKGEGELSSDGTTKVTATAEVGGNVGPLKLPGGQAEIVTKNAKGESEAPAISFTKPGIDKGKTELTVGKGEIKFGISLYAGWGGGVSVTIRPQVMMDNAVKWLESGSPSPGTDFNTNQHGMGAWQ
jgi:hypothetical protein